MAMDDLLSNIFYIFVFFYDKTEYKMSKYCQYIFYSIFFSFWQIVNKLCVNILFVFGRCGVVDKWPAIVSVIYKPATNSHPSFSPFRTPWSVTWPRPQCLVTTGTAHTSFHIQIIAHKTRAPAETPVPPLVLHARQYIEYKIFN